MRVLINRIHPNPCIFAQTNFVISARGARRVRVFKSNRHFSLSLLIQSTHSVHLAVGLVRMAKHVQELELMNNTTEEQFYAELKDWPRPQYPFSDLVNPNIDKVAAECNEWINHDCLFESKQAREAHRRHRFTDVAARAFLSLTLRRSCTPWLALRPFLRS